MNNKVELNFLERTISLFSPKAALKRMQARLTYDLLSKRFYEGASKGRRTEGWRAPSSSANSENHSAIGVLRDRARDLVRNQPFAKKGLQAIVSNTIGCGIRTQIKTQNKNSRGIGPLIEAHAGWAETTACDYDGRLDYYGLQSLVLQTVAEAGECLIVRKRMPSSDGFIPIKLQILEPDYIDTSRQASDTLQGIQFDDNGRRKAYWLWKRHPGDNGILNFLSRQTIFSELIPAEDVIHVFRQDRAGQIRGSSWFAPVIITMRELDEYMDATIVKQKIAASFAAFVHDLEGMDSTGDNPAISDKLEPGIIEILPPGKDIKFSTPPSVMEFDSFTRTILRSVASGLGITYECLTNDYSQVNFSSGRMGWLEFQRNIDSWRSNIMIAQVCNPISEWFFQAAELRGLNRNGAYVVHTAPAREMIDPNAETNALITQIRTGLKTLPEAMREQGYDPDTQLQEIADSNKALDQKGIILDCDPRKIMKSSGSLQAAPNAAPANPPQNG